MQIQISWLLQKPTNLDLHCLQRQGISGFSRTKISPTLAKHDMPVWANNVDPDQLASEEANWSGSALFVIKYVNFYQNPDQVIWLAGYYKWAWHLNLFGMARVKVNNSKHAVPIYNMHAVMLVLAIRHLHENMLLYLNLHPETIPMRFCLCWGFMA